MGNRDKPVDPPIVDGVAAIRDMPDHNSAEYMKMKIATSMGVSYRNDKPVDPPVGPLMNRDKPVDPPIVDGVAATRDMPDHNSAEYIKMKIATAPKGVSYRNDKPVDPPVGPLMKTATAKGLNQGWNNKNGRNRNGNGKHLNPRKGVSNGNDKPVDPPVGPLMKTATAPKGRNQGG